MTSNKETTRRSGPLGRVVGAGEPRLVVTCGASAGRSAVVQTPELILGKAADAGLVLQDSGVSRHHAKVVRASDGICNIIDLGSTNGVWVNTTRIDVSVLREGDRVHLGPEAELLFTYESAVEIPTMAPRTTPLSPRQLEVAQLVCHGLTNEAVAKRLGISRRTVTTHLDHIYARLEIGSRAELASYLAKRGYV